MATGVSQQFTFGGWQHENYAMDATMKCDRLRDLLLELGFFSGYPCDALQSVARWVRAEN